MPKNVVQRLQKIESDLKTVVSLYEVADKSKNHDKPKTSKEQNSKQFSKIGAPKRMETVPVFDKFREVPGKPQTPLLDPLKKTNGFISRSPQGLHSGESVTGKKCKQKKPGSAPSSCSTLSTICESDYIWQQSSETDGSLEQGLLTKSKTFENLNSDWLDSNPAFPEYAVVMTASKTLETANQILAKYNINENEDHNKLLTHEQVRFYLRAKGTERCETGEETSDSTLDVKNSESKNSDVIGKAQADNNESNGSLSVKNEKSLEHIIEWIIPVKSGSFVTTKIYKSDEDPEMKEPPIVFVTSEEDKKAQQKKSSSEIIKNLRLKMTKFSPSKTRLSNEDVRGEKKIREKEKEKERENEREKEKGKDKRRLEVKAKLSERFNFNKLIKSEEKSNDKVEEKKTWSIFEKDKKQQKDDDAQKRINQKKNNAEENDDAELWLNELSNIIEKSNEKLEKMKESKELALKIAKHLKDKYDEIRKSKEELLEKVKTLEKNNERLNTEIKETRELKYQLQQKIEGSRNSKTRLMEDPKPRDVDKEIFWLKTKLSGKQKKNSDDAEPAVKIEEIEKERVVGSKKSREILLGKIQTLSTEKSDLLTKLNELQRQVFEKESQEENVRQLKEEVQKQKQILKIKTEALHETNRELEIIRQNSAELEEQVRVLKKNLDDFENIQKNLMKQTSEYEQRIKEDDEKMRELQEENQRLKGELENEKDGLLIKAKIIEDQQETIKQLKEKVEEVKTLVKKNQSLERILNNERDEKIELREAVELLKWRKQELKQKVRTLENDFLLAPQEVVKDLQKTQVVLHELENQVQVKQKEWEFQLQSLVKEKEQACRVAEFATKKLRETTNEFQKQSDAYKGLQRILAQNLAIKQKVPRKGSNNVKNP